MSFDDAYESLTDHDDDARWAYGTGFADPLAGVPADLPADTSSLAADCLALGDDALVMSQRLQQWVTRAPELEDELALANIALDLLGQARLLLSRAAQVVPGASEDSLAYLRDAPEFRNVCLAERTDDDFAHLVARLLAFSAWRLALFGSLTSAADPVLAAIAAKGVKELAYHREYAAGWVVRLGDGTPTSHARMQAAVDALWPRLGELSAFPEVPEVWDQVLTAATLRRPADVAYSGPYGRDGDHTSALTTLLAEMQGLARSLPGGVW
jgi:ring-1,2-phenylacetyl-CoA epoxidase subunit PaaC